MAGGKGTGTLKMIGTVGGRAGSAKSSPAKPTQAKTTVSKTPTKAAAKRKQALNEDIGSNASDVENVKETPSKKAKKNWATTDVQGIKSEGESTGMDGSFEARFTMPGEI
ncbi:MAG: hypothetical protein Q9223_007686 [Gallowayella weberi]